MPTGKRIKAETAPKGAILTEQPQALPDYIREASEGIAGLIKPNATGRPTKLTPQTAQNLLALIRAGNYTSTACAASGVSYERFRQWLEKGEEDGPESALGRFRAAVKRAEGEAESESVSQVRRAGEDPRFWAASMTFLERRHAARWRRQDTSQVQLSVDVVAMGIGVGQKARMTALETIEAQIVSNQETPALSPSVSTDIHRLTEANE